MANNFYKLAIGEEFCNNCNWQRYMAFVQVIENDVYPIDISRGFVR